MSISTGADIGPLFDQFIAAFDPSASLQFDLAYYATHRKRFLQTARFIPHAANDGARALELGATGLFQVALGSVFGYAPVLGTHVTSDVERKRYRRSFEIGRHKTSNLLVSIDLESDIYPFEDASIDFILCGEVIEHMDVDPMFMLAECNRILKPGGSLLITTPNCCSARNFWKIAQGYRPHFFMQYERSRNPYRHNIEYDVHSVVQLLRAAGFAPTSVETFDVFEEPLADGIALLKSAGLPLDHRGDCIFALARKTSGVVDRWPAGLYV